METREQKFHLPPRRGPDLVAIPADRELLAQHGRLDPDLVGKLHPSLQRRAFHFLRQTATHIGKHEFHFRRAIRAVGLRQKHSQKGLQNLADNLVRIFPGRQRLGSRRPRENRERRKKGQTFFQHAETIGGYLRSWQRFVLHSMQRQVHLALRQCKAAKC